MHNRLTSRFLRLPLLGLNVAKPDRRPKVPRQEPKGRRTAGQGGRHADAQRQGTALPEEKENSREGLRKRAPEQEGPLPDVTATESTRFHGGVRCASTRDAP